MRGRNLLLVLLSVGAAPLFAQHASDSFTGRRLEDALRLLQGRGARIVFSSELVTPEMRVRAEPRAGTPREQLREMLEPHGLTCQDGPGGVILVVRRTKAAAEPTRSAPSPPRDQPAAPRGSPSSLEPAYRERLTVTASGRGPGELNVETGRHLDANELEALGGRIADDPLRLVHSLPGVAAADDFRSEYSVRGSSYRHAAVVVDGVDAPWLQHGAMGRADSGTLTMMSGDVVQGATLFVGAYPRKDGGQIGPELQLTLREGSRSARAFRGSVSGMSAIVRAEGPLGEPARGSWIAAIRRSHVEWPAGRDDHRASVFGFTDAQSKFVYDVRSGQQIAASLVAGVSNTDRDVPDALGAAVGLNRAAMVSVAWRSLIAPRTVVTQRLSLLSHDALDRDGDARAIRRGADAAVVYRVDLTRAALGGILETGGQVRRMRGARHGPMDESFTAIVPAAGPGENDVRASWLERSGYASFHRVFGPRVSVVAGVRAAGSTLVGRSAVDRWLQAHWAASPGWVLHASTGTVHQFAAIDQVRGRTRRSEVRPERATHLDLGIARRLHGSVQFDATLYARREQNILGEPLALLPADGDGPIGGSSAGRLEHALSGSARGVELTIARRGRDRFSGWIAYSLGVARQADAARGETFDADRDQRHAVNASGTVVLPDSTTLGATFRSGSNFPIPGYLASRDGRLVASGRRNELRLPAYARLDIRAERAFHYGGRPFVLFVDTLNVLNRTNLGLAGGRMSQDPRDAAALYEPLFPRLITAGIRFEF